MKEKFSLLITFVELLFSQAISQDNNPELTDVIDSKTLGINITLDNPSEIILIESNEVVIKFEIIELSTGYACRVRPKYSVQILDNSTHGYPDALQLDELIENEGHWSASKNFVIGTSVGHAGQFEEKGPRYLGFRVSNKGNYLYGWILLEINKGNTSVQIKSYGINKTIDRGILAGQIQ